MVYLHPGHNQSDKLANSLAANPDITFIVHGDQIVNDIGDLIERYPNIYYTVDALYGDQYLLRPEETIDSFLAATSDYKPLLAADLVKWKSIIEEHPDRFMWGTDRGGSAVWTYDLQVSLRLVDYGRAFIGGLDPDVQERFAYMNAARLLAGLRAEAAGSDEWRRPEAACQRTRLASGSMFAAACEGDAEHLARDPARDSDELRETEHAVVQPQQKPQPDAVSTTQLGLPFRIADLDGSSGFFSPFGIVRWSLDRPEYGHSGIDIPLRENATLYAVADARVLSIAPTVDDRPGQIMTILFDLDAPAGEGWGFIYEHVYPLDGVATGMHVARGQAIARTALTPLEANNHLQLSYFFHAFQYTRTHTCWVDWLEVADAQPLVALFAEISGQVGFELAWGTAREEEALPYQALLDERQFPNGPRLCYPPGTDVRER